MDDFGVKYLKKDDAHHLITSLQKYYDITIDWSGQKFVVWILSGIMIKNMWIFR